MKYKYLTSFLLCSVLSLIILASTTIASLPTNPLSFSPTVTNKLNAIYYQGWGFYSKDTRDPLLYAIPLDGNDQLSWPNNKIRHFFGLNREGRSQGIELGAILSNLKPEDYSSCDRKSEECFQEVDVVMVVTNKSRHPRICGTWGITYTDPIPWSWGKSKDAINMPSEIAKVEIKCSKG